METPNSCLRNHSDRHNFRWGVIGTGHATNKFCVAVNADSTMCIDAVASRTEEGAQKFGEQFGCRRTYDSYQAMIANADIDAIYVATPATHHCPAVELALQSDIPVLCEKPLAATLSDVERMVSIAAERGVLLVEAQWNRFVPTMIDVLDRIRRGRIGTIQHIFATFGKPLDPVENQRLYSNELGGGALLDLGIYPVSLAHAVFDDSPEEIVPSCVHYQNGVDSMFSAEMRFQGNRTATIAASINHQLPGFAEIHGTHGMIFIHDFWRPEVASLERPDREPLLIEFPFSINGMEYQARHFIDCVVDGLCESPLMKLQDSVAVHQTLGRIRSRWPGIPNQSDSTMSRKAV